MSGHTPLADVLRLTACNLEAIRRGALYKDFYTGAQGESGDTITRHPFLCAAALRGLHGSKDVGKGQVQGWEEG